MTLRETLNTAFDRGYIREPRFQQSLTIIFADSDGYVCSVPISHEALDSGDAVIAKQAIDKLWLKREQMRAS